MAESDIQGKADETDDSDTQDTQEKPKGSSTIKRIWKTFEKMLSDEVDPDEDN